MFSNWTMKPEDMMVFEQMQQAIYALYTKHKGDRLAYKTELENLALEKMPAAPVNVKQIFVNFALDVYDECMKKERESDGSGSP